MSADVHIDLLAITNLLNRYAELIDAGQFDEVGQLFRHARFRYADGDTSGPQGADAIAATYHATTRLYPDGTPRTRHVMANPIIELDGDTAMTRSTYTVFQQTDDLPLQPIISGRYHDQLERIDGEWTFTDRRFFMDLVGDLTHHLLIDLP